MNKHNNISQIKTKKKSKFALKSLGYQCYCYLRSNSLQIVTSTCFLWLNMTCKFQINPNLIGPFMGILIVFSGKTLAYTETRE